MMRKAPPEMGSSSDKQTDTHLLTIPPPVQTPQAFVASSAFEQGRAKSAPPMKSRRTRRGVPNRTSLLDDSSHGGTSSPPDALRVYDELNEIELQSAKVGGDAAAGDRHARG